MMKDAFFKASLQDKVLSVFAGNRSAPSYCAKQHDGFDKIPEKMVKAL